MSNFLKNRLKTRAKGLSAARTFFAERNVLEVDCLALGESGAIDPYIDLFETSSPFHEKLFLFSSPEYAMKRLLSEGSGDIYYLGHVFRNEASGKKHSPEFLMAEWYREGFSFEQMVEETLAFCRIFINIPKTVYLSYKEAFVRYLNIDPFTCSDQDLKDACRFFSGYPIETSPRDELLNLLLGISIEPKFDPHAITVLYHYPPSQAALARIVESEETKVALRFELYAKGLELANGYNELIDPVEQESRFIQDNEKRILLGKNPYPIDYAFLKALKKGLPSCSGVAVGVDRLLMIQQNGSSIKEVQAVSFDESEKAMKR